jgi:hypothetical protein
VRLDWRAIGVVSQKAHFPTRKFLA